MSDLTDNKFYPSAEQRREILRYYFENHGNVSECVQRLGTDFGRRKAPSPSAPHVRYLVKKVKETGMFIDKSNVMLNN